MNCLFSDFRDLAEMQQAEDAYWLTVQHIQCVIWEEKSTINLRLFSSKSSINLNTSFSLSNKPIFELIFIICINL